MLPRLIALAALALPLAWASDVGDDGYPKVPSDAVQVGLESPWITHVGDWYKVEPVGRANATDTPAFTNSSGSISFSAPGTNAYWRVYNDATFRIHIDGIPQPAVLWPSRPRGSWHINASTTYGWHNWTLEVVGNATERGQVTMVSLDTTGKGGYTPSKPSSVGDGKQMPDWLSLGDKSNWYFKRMTTAEWSWSAITNTTGETLTIRPPKGTVHAGATGVSEADLGAYTVTIVPAPVLGPAVCSYARSDAPVFVTELFLADLDPAVQYEITVRNDGEGQLGIMEASFTKNKLTVILPAVIAPVVLLAALGGAYLWWRRRGQRATKDYTELKPFIKVDERASTEG